MERDSYPVQWAGRQAIVTLPDQIDVANADQIREQLLTLINRGAAALTVDMTATQSCDHAGADAVVRAYQRAVANGTQMQLVVTAHIVRRVLSLNGIDRLIPVYPSLEATTAAGAPAAVAGVMAGPGKTGADGQAPSRPGARRPHPRWEAGPRRGPRTAAIAPWVLWGLADALADGIALADAEGVLELVNRRLADMFGYGYADLIGQPVESLIPADLRAAHRSHRAGYAQAPVVRRMGTGIRLVGLRKDGATFPVEVSLSPVPTPAGQYTLAVVRNLTERRRHEHLTSLADQLP